MGIERMVLSAALAALAVAPAAQGATVSIADERGDADILVFVAAPGERNDVTLTFAPGYAHATVADEGSALTAGAHCEQLAPTTVRCPEIHGFEESRFDLGDGDDRLTVSPVPRMGATSASTTVDAGAGDDVVTTAGGYDVLDGGPGRDELSGGTGIDRLIDADPAEADVLDGGGGTYDTDVVDYSDRTGAVSVDLQRGTGGARREGDELRGIEGVVGTVRADRLAGDDGDNALTGLGGADAIAARGGADEVVAGTGDQVSCGAGGDEVRGRTAASTYLSPSCEELVVANDTDEEGIGTATVAVGPRGRPLTYALGWFDAWSDVTGRVTWREATGARRLLGFATLRATSEEGAAVPVRLTALGRLLAARGVRATARLDATLLASAAWSMTLRR